MRSPRGLRHDAARFRHRGVGAAFGRVEIDFGAHLARARHHARVDVGSFRLRGAGSILSRFGREGFGCGDVRPRNGALCGFSTIGTLEVPANGTRVRAVYSGDTVIDPAYWGENAWIGVATKRIFALADQVAPEPAYWLLLTATHRSYRLMAGMFREYYPRPDQPTPPEVQADMDALARAKFPAEYESSRGVITLARATPVRPERFDPAAESRDDAEVRISRGPTRAIGMAIFWSASRSWNVRISPRWAGVCWESRRGPRNSALTPSVAKSNHGANLCRAIRGHFWKSPRVTYVGIRTKNARWWYNCYRRNRPPTSAPLTPRPQETCACG